MACREEAGEARKADGQREEEPGKEGKDESARRHRKDIKGRSLSLLVDFMYFSAV